MNISAKDKSTGKENKITIKSDSGLSEAEIQRMVREAEENAEADKKARELIDAKNQAEAASHSVNKDFETYKDQLTDEEKSAYETAKTSLNEAMSSDDKEKINEAVGKLFEAAGPVMAKKQAAESAAQNPAQPQGEQTVDAEFKEVDKKD